MNYTNNIITKEEKFEFLVLIFEDSLFLIFCVAGYEKQRGAGLVFSAFVIVHCSFACSECWRNTIFFRVALNFA